MSTTAITWRDLMSEKNYPIGDSSQQSVNVAPSVDIPFDELEIRATTGGGPGGQHVNRSATRIELRWNARDSLALDSAQRDRVLSKLGPRLDTSGSLRIVAGEYRSQLRNRVAAIERFAALVSRALVVQPTRRATKPGRGAVERRLSEKRKRSETKRRRRDVDSD